MISRKHTFGKQKRHLRTADLSVSLDHKIPFIRIMRCYGHYKTCKSCFALYFYRIWCIHFLENEPRNVQIYQLIICSIMRRFNWAKLSRNSFEIKGQYIPLICSKMKCRLESTSDDCQCTKLGKVRRNSGNLIPHTLIRECREVLTIFIIVAHF